ncbi:hypothetical protein [Streptomyces sp. NPDC004042]|uniref:hypothetical protein n=1 Tax=Streptomyces sp. NPDC004042 TaxID=3154451 RepID=UPI0033BDB857
MYRLVTDATTSAIADKEPVRVRELRLQKWSVLQGCRETRGHFVLLSRDPDIICLEVLPEHALSTAEESTVCGPSWTGTPRLT